MPPPTGPSRSTASPPTPARRSPRGCSTAIVQRSGTRRRTACTPRRRSSSGWSAAERNSVAGVEGLADDHRDAPAGHVGAALVGVVAGVELRRQLPEALALGSLRLAGAIHAAATAGPQLDFRVGLDVVEPGWMPGLSGLRTDQDDVVRIGEIDERRHPLLAALRSRMGEKDG